MRTKGVGLLYRCDGHIAVFSIISSLWDTLMGSTFFFFFFFSSFWYCYYQLVFLPWLLFNLAVCVSYLSSAPFFD